MSESIYSPSELLTKGSLVFLQKAGLLDENELSAALSDINAPKQEAIDRGEIPSSFLPDVFSLAADIAESVLESVLDAVSASLD